MHNAHIIAYLEHHKLLDHSIQESLASIQLKLFGTTNNKPFQQLSLFI